MKTEKKRIIWIDWAKVIGITIVVYCHIPQEKTLFIKLLWSFQMPLFFLLSGYLHKPLETLGHSLRKYSQTIIIPYLLFQVLSYPYWLVQQSVQEGLNLQDIQASFITPFLRSLYGVPINGITWFLVALLIMKLMIDLAAQFKHQDVIAAIICIIATVVTWQLGKESSITISFAIDGMFKFTPFFFLGYYLKKYEKRKTSLLQTDNYWQLVAFAIICLIIMLAIIKYGPSIYLFKQITHYVLGVMGSFLIIAICKLFSRSTAVVQTISKGTIIVLGFHWMFIGSTNFVLERVLQLDGGIHYPILYGVLLAIAIVMANYLIILFCERHFTILLGGRIKK